MLRKGEEKAEMLVEQGIRGMRDRGKATVLVRAFAKLRWHRMVRWDS